MAFSFIFIIAMNCYLRWLKKTSDFCFATQLFTTVLKSKLSDMIPFPPAAGKDWGSQMTTKLPIRVKTAPIGLYISSQMKRTQHRPVVLNLITALETNGALLLSPHCGGTCKEWRALICFVHRPAVWIN